MLLSIEAAIDDCVKGDGRIVAAFLTESCSIRCGGATLGILDE
jgi:hypothetical protein